MGIIHRRKEIGGNMLDTKELIKIKEYDKYILFKHKDTGIRECILKIDLIPPEDKKVKYERLRV